MKTFENMSALGALLWLLVVGVSIYGIYISFCASIILGIIVFFTPPSGAIIGTVMLLTGTNLAQIIVQLVTKLLQ